MGDSGSSHSLFVEPPDNADDSLAWGRWATEFLDRFSQLWIAWRKTWNTTNVPVYRPGNPDAFLILERDTRIVGFSAECVRSGPPQGFGQAARLLDAVSAAVLRFGDQGSWRFKSGEKVDAVADSLLVVAQFIDNQLYEQIPETTPSELARVVKMATRRLGSVDDFNDLPKKKRKPPGGRPRMSPRETKKRLDLVEQWQRAKNAGVRQKDFCTDNDIALEHLTKCLNWAVQSRRRGNKS